jgi:hypothetical protein
VVDYTKYLLTATALLLCGNIEYMTISSLCYWSSKKSLFLPVLLSVFCQLLTRLVPLPSPGPDIFGSKEELDAYTENHDVEFLSSDL